MKTRIIITNTLCMLLFMTMACQQERAQGAEANAPFPILPTDEVLGHGYVRRDGAIHFIGGGTTGTGANATRIDTPSRRVLRGFRAAGIGPFETAAGLDVDAFVPLSEEYSHDGCRVFYKVISPGVFLVIELAGADPESFEPLAFNLARDKNHVWYYGSLQDGVDAASLEMIDGGVVYKDKDAVYHDYSKIHGADPASFRHIASAYYADKNRVYWSSSPIPDADVDSFEVLGGSFLAKDKDRVYRSGIPLPEIDAASVRLLLHNPAGYQIFSDNNGIHLNTMIFPRSGSGEAEVLDELSVKSGDLVHLISLYQGTPVTVFRKDGVLMAEAPVYDPEKGEVLGTMTAEVTPDGLEHVRISPLPGSTDTPSVPRWQMAAFNRDDLVQRMNEAGERIP